MAASRILCNSVNLLSLFSTKFPKPTSKLACLSFSRKQSSTRVVASALKQQHKLNLLISYSDHKSSRKLSLLSTEDNRISSITHPVIGLPIASSNNELLLCESLGSKREGAALWNPTTDYVKILPKSSVPRSPKVEWVRELEYGLGFDPKASQEEPLDYKVVRFLSARYCDDYTTDLLQAELYSLKTDSWKGIAVPPYISPLNSDDIHINGSIHINGFFYWPVVDLKGVIRFDFAKEEFSSSHIPLPETDKFIDEDSRYNFILGEFEGSLAVVAYSFADILGTDVEKPFEFEIWVWNDDDESWTRKRVCQIIVPSGSAGCRRPLGLLKNEKLYLGDFLGEIVVFDCGNGRLTNTGFRFVEYFAARIYPYVESSAEEVKYREILSGRREILSNSTASISKLVPIETDTKQKHNNNKLKHMINLEHMGIFYCSTTDSDDVFFNFPSLDQSFYPAASCNNALLLCNLSCGCFKDGAALWNPTTDHVKKLPDDVSSSRGYLLPWCYSLGFDPKQAAASQDYDYKVIRFVENNEWDHVLQVELYSLKTDSWKDITPSYPDDCASASLIYQPCIHINGFSYWQTAHNLIISFDFANEKFSSAPHIPLPPPCDEKLGPDLRLAEFHGSLAALVHRSGRNNENKPFEMEIWVWNIDESSWARVVPAIHVQGVDVAHPLGLLGNDQLYLQGFKNELFLYDYAKGGELKNPGLAAIRVFPYIESSFPLDGKKMIRASHKIIND